MTGAACKNGAPPLALFACIDGKLVVVVGGGRVGERKVRSLLEHGAHVRVVAPELTPGLAGMAGNGDIEWVGREFKPDDLEGAILAVGASDDRAVNEAVHGAADAAGMLVNVVDVPELCTFIVPSVVRRGKLQIAVSTSGASPSTARDIRKSLENEFPAWWEEYIDLLADVRLLVKERVPGAAEARTALHEAVASGELASRVAHGDVPDAEAVYQQMVVPMIERRNA